MSRTNLRRKSKHTFLCLITFFSFFEKLSIMVIMWKNYGKTRQVTDDNTTRLTRFARWITNATNTHSEYVTRIALPLQQWLHERTSLLRYTYIACLAITETDCVYCAVRTKSSIYFSSNDVYYFCLY